MARTRDGLQVITAGPATERGRVALHDIDAAHPHGPHETTGEVFLKREWDGSAKRVRVGMSDGVREALRERRIMLSKLPPTDPDPTYAAPPVVRFEPEDDQDETEPPLPLPPPGKVDTEVAPSETTGDPPAPDDDVVSNEPTEELTLDLLMKKSRLDLNFLAVQVGIEQPQEMPKKEDVAEAILAAVSAEGGA